MNKKGNREDKSIEKLREEIVEAILEKNMLSRSPVSSQFIKKEDQFIKKEDKFDRVLKKLKQNKELQEYYDDLAIDLGILRTFAVTKGETKEERRKQIEEEVHDLTEKKEYTVLFLLPYDLDIGVRLDKFKVIEKDESREEVKKYITNMKKTNNMTKMEKEGYSLCQIKFETYAISIAQKIFEKQLEVLFSMLALLLREHITFRSTLKDSGVIAIYVDEKEEILYRESDVSQDNEKEINRREINRKEINRGELKELLKLNELSEKLKVDILNSLTIYWLALSSEKKEIQFLLIVTAMESLLHVGRGGITEKIAERTAFLLKGKGERMEVYDAMKENYELRSGIAHQGKKEGITSEKVDEVSDFYRELVFRIIELTVEQGDKFNIETFVKEKKFN